MTITLIFAFPATLLTIILFFISCNFIQSKISFSLLSGSLHKNSKKLNNLYGLGYYIFILCSLVPSLVFLYVFKIEVNPLLLLFLIILIPILKITIENSSHLFSLLVYLIISYIIVQLLNFKTESIIDLSFIGLILAFMLLINFLLTKLFISEIKLLFLNAIITFSICSLAIIVREQTLFFINLTVFTSSTCLLLFNKLNKKHKILITQSGKIIIGCFLFSSILCLLKVFFID